MRLTEDFLYVNQAVIPFEEVDNLLIYADEYTGMAKDGFGTYHGGGNEISFTHKGKAFKFNFWIKNRKELDYVEQLVARIELKYTPPKT